MNLKQRWNDIDGKTKKLRDKAVLVPLFLPQIALD
jgi:hypothetical protein